MPQRIPDLSRDVRDGADPERCQDTCRADCLACLRHARVAPDTLASLEAELEALEADISERT